MSMRPSQARGPNTNNQGTTGPEGPAGPPGPPGSGQVFFGTSNSLLVENTGTTPLSLLGGASLGSLEILNTHLLVGRALRMEIPMQYSLEALEICTLSLLANGASFFSFNIVQPFDEDLLYVMFTLTNLNSAGRLTFTGQGKWGSNFDPSVSAISGSIATGANMTLAATASFSTATSLSSILVLPVTFELLPVPVGLNV